MNELDHLHIDLAGRNLIEASAGTGKTYAIACFYLRLLVENHLTPEQVLVVTYTEAATEELRGRIRSRIREALEVFSGSPTEDAFLAGLCANANGRGPDRVTAIENLDRALKTFDTASIFTIHGFCLRALQDNAFESGALYDTDLIADQSDLLQEIVDDFWRSRFFSEPAPLLGYALRKGFSPDKLVRFLKGMMGNPKLEIIPSFSQSEISQIETTCHSLFARLQKLWRDSQTEVEDIITNDKGLSRSADNYRQDLLPGLLAGMSAYLSGDNPFDEFTGFEKFSTREIEAQRLKKHSPPHHGFFDLCDELLSSIEKRFLALRWELVEFARERLPAGKQALNIRFFDDLLNDLYGALHKATGESLAEKLRVKYSAALIDEFQDTDPVQYDIFRKIYAGTDHPLFLIGDPKQAIYSFRGADIFAYLEAAADVPETNRFTLTHNWRSTPRLLDAFNTVFRNSSKPFVFDAIAYHPVTAGKPDTASQLAIAGDDDAPLQVWFIPPDDQGHPVTVGKAISQIAAAVAAEISRLLKLGAEGLAIIDGRPVVPDDIAVIVRSHRQAGYIQDALKSLAIPSVMRSDTSLFASEDARQVHMLLNALADPGDESKIKAALATDILGKSGNDINVILEDEQAWEEVLARFRGYHHTWLDRGFMVTARAVLDQEVVRGRLLRRPDGERRLTNLLHCFEVIHQAAHDKGFGIEGALTWFGERLAAKDAAEEYQIRLETDEKAVKIVTIHISKGLEYPIVFCPYLWGGSADNEEIVSFHDSFTMVKDFGSADYEQHRSRARNEALAEGLRLLYVALTRAKFKCYLSAGKIVDRTRRNRPETSPLAYLFHTSPETRAAADPVARMAEEVTSLSAQTMEVQLQSFAAQGEDIVSVKPLPTSVNAASYCPAADTGNIYACRRFTAPIDSSWRVTSFTSFAAHDVAPAELPDRDETHAPGDFPVSGDIPLEPNIYTFPKGAQAGIFLHEIFEQLDFANCTTDAIRSLTATGLEKYGYEKQWLPHICTMISNVTQVPLQTTAGAFSLATIGKGKWITELEFFFPLKFVTSSMLKDCFQRWNEKCSTIDLKRINRTLGFKPVQGMVRGFMDMVFEHGGKYYLVDWKSNHLGYRVEDYGQDRLRSEMERNLYPLQYLLYTVALNRYLSLRVRGYRYGTHFGGVCYLFIRGIVPVKGEEYGVFRDTPPEGLVDELTELLIQVGG